MGAPLFTLSRRIALVGLANAGKTVFLTSLLNHLIEHDPARFSFGNGARITSFRLHPVPAAVGAAFPYTHYRDKLARRGQWPNKTRTSCHFICSFHRSDWRLCGSRLHFFDFPGERLADAAVAGHDDYAAWSDHLLGALEECDEYLAAAERPDLTADQVLAAYRVLLARRLSAHQPLISPSVFLLNEAGNKTSAETVVRLARGEAMENPPACPFAPLAATARRRHPALERAFAQAYRRYRREVVVPVFGDLRAASRWIVLIDLPALLNGGVGMYNAHRQMLSDLFAAQRDDSLIGRWLRALFLAPPALQRVAFVAVKTDLVHPHDVENGNVLRLLRGMTDRFQREHPGIEMRCFAAAAVVSTRLGAGARRLIARPAGDNAAQAEVEYDAPTLPEAWPETWRAGEYVFPRVWPRMPDNHQLPPEQLGVDLVFDFITRE